MFHKLALVLALGILAGVPAEAYYHYIYYYRSTPFFPMQAKFDVTQLANNTVVFTVADSGPSTYYPNDSFGSVLAEVKQALAEWNSVQSSSLRVAFGGLQPAQQASNTPGAEVVFDNLGPGVLGLTSVSMPASPTFSGEFVPILHSQVELTNNTSTTPGPSYNETFFTTAVHEIGHAMGLQHTWTAAAMSQAIVRNTSRARPIDADDIAGLSVLYPASNWLANYGTISGHVNYTNGGAVSLASVVAIPANGPAVSTLTNPDGSYTIYGLPPNTYQLYVHPLPPDAVVAGGEGLQLPTYDNGQAVGASGSFYTVFYPGVQDPSQASQFVVAAGSTLPNQDFSVQARSGVPAYDLITYSYLDPVSHTYPANPGASSANDLFITPAYIDSTQSQCLVVVSGPGSTVAAPQWVNMLGVGRAFYSQLFSSNAYLALAFALSPTEGVGPRHLVFNYGNDIFVLPDGVNLVQKGPPAVTLAAANGDGTVTVAGSGFSFDSRVYFDGMQAPGVYNPATNSIQVTPPSAGSGQVSTVSVSTSDGQNSLLLQSSNPPTYTYPSAVTPQITRVAPAPLPATLYGVPVSAMVDIQAAGTQFVDGQVTVGFGSTDISVSKVWVLSPTHLAANVLVSPGALTGSLAVSVVSGMQVMEQAGAFQLQAVAGAPEITTIVNGVTNLAGALYVGSYGILYGLNLGQSASGIQLTLNGVAAQVLYASPAQINFVAPPGVGVGPAALALTTGTGSASVEVQMANFAPTITGITGQSAGPAITPGDVLTVTLTGFDSSVAANPSRLQVTVAGLAMPVVSISSGQVQFAVTQSFGGTLAPVAVAVDGAASAPVVLTAR